MKPKIEISSAKKSPKPTEKGFSFNQCYAFLRVCAVVLIILALFVFTIRVFSHVHLEIDVPEGTWDEIERSENKTAWDRVNEDPENASDKDREKAWEHEQENTA